MLDHYFLTFTLIDICNSFIQIHVDFAETKPL